jgi:hypothetical protein
MNTRPHKRSARPSNDAMYAPLLAGFTELLGVEGRPFGKKTNQFLELVMDAKESNGIWRYTGTRAERR